MDATPEYLGHDAPRPPSSVDRGFDEETASPTQMRSLVVPVIVSDERYSAVLGSIRQVRAASRQIFACLFAAQAAGADIEWNDDHLRVMPNNDRAKTIMEAVFNKSGKLPVYSARQYVLDHLLPTCHSFVWDVLRRSVWTRWTSRDPEFPVASGGYLALNGVRRLADFAHIGIGLPRATARPVLELHRIRLRWDREVGEVELRVGTLAPGRWHIWRQIVSGEVGHGTIQLNERDGRVFCVVPYPIECRAVDVDPNRTLTVSVSEDSATLRIAGPDGAKTYDSIDLREARDWLRRLKSQRLAWEARRASCGSPRKPWGERRRFRAVCEHLERVTRCRDSGRRTRNHAWAKRIMTRAVDWRCGRISIEVAQSGIAGEPWSWTELADLCRYKAQAAGIKAVDRIVQAPSEPDPVSD